MAKKKSYSQRYKERYAKRGAIVRSIAPATLGAGAVALPVLIETGAGPAVAVIGGTTIGAGLLARRLEKKWAKSRKGLKKVM
ncbi:MAG: hypothetical protein PVI03_01425 [Candidatus Thorarchaeota archaeon]|jgi:hypothetical protein